MSNDTQVQAHMALVDAYGLLRAQRSTYKYDGGVMAKRLNEKAEQARAAVEASARQLAEQPGFVMVQSPITEEMHVAAVKVLHRANGVEGLPQRMLDAMLAARPLTASPTEENRVIPTHNKE